MDYSGGNQNEQQRKRKTIQKEFSQEVGSENIQTTKLLDSKQIWLDKVR